MNTTFRDIIENETDHNIEASIDYSRSFAKEDQKLSVAVKYILDDDTEIADYNQTDSSIPGFTLQRSDNTEDERNFLFQAEG